MARPAPQWSLSIVSHGHAGSVARLLGDCARHLEPSACELIVTANLSGEAIDTSAWPGVLVRIDNARPQGFGANHDAALSRAAGTFFACLDPDLRLRGDPFPALADALGKSGLRLAAPRVTDSAGRVQDHARSVVTPASLLRRHAGFDRDDPSAPRPRRVDWLAGLFIAGRTDTWRALGGFDAGYHLYCEDTDLCLRCWNAGGEVWALTGDEVVHDPRRRTLRSARHFAWHVASLLRLWRSESFREFAQRRS